MRSGTSCAGGRDIGRLTITSEAWQGGRSEHQEIFCHGSTRKKNTKTLMATESTEEHGKIILGRGAVGTR